MGLLLRVRRLVALRDQSNLQTLTWWSRWEHRAWLSLNLENKFRKGHILIRSAEWTAERTDVYFLLRELLANKQEGEKVFTPVN